MDTMLVLKYGNNCVINFAFRGKKTQQWPKLKKATIKWLKTPKMSSWDSDRLEKAYKLPKMAKIDVKSLKMVWHLCDKQPKVAPEFPQCHKKASKKGQQRPQMEKVAKVMTLTKRTKNSPKRPNLCQFFFLLTCVLPPVKPPPPPSQKQTLWLLDGG